VLFVIFFSWFFFRKQEAVTLRVVMGGVISVVGAFIIVSGR
jgi:drug/metabolite transporter (DMT)-like permease